MRAYEAEQASRLLNAQGGAQLLQMSGGASAASAPGYTTSSQSLVLAVPKGSVEDPQAAGRRAELAALHRLPLRPHRPRRNSFDLISLARAHPDLPEYSDGWETCDSEDERYQEVFGFYEDEGRESEAKAEAARRGGSAGAGATGGAAAPPARPG